MNTENLEFHSLPRDEFGRLPAYPGNCLFFVCDKRVTEQGVTRSIALYKGDVPVSFEDVLSLVPDNIKMSDGGFRAMAFAKSIGKPEKPKETDFEFYKDLVNSEGLWRARPDASLDQKKGEALWASWHWFNGDEANTLDSGDEWTDPLQVSGMKMTLEDLSEEDFAELQRPATEAAEALKAFMEKAVPWMEEWMEGWTAFKSFHRVPPVYKTPSFSNGNILLEAGSPLPAFSPEYVQGDGGALKEWTVSWNGEGQVSGVGEPVSWNADGGTVPDGESAIDVSFDYDGGEVRKDNFGEDYPEGKIEAGSGISSFRVKGLRFAFFHSGSEKKEWTGTEVHDSEVLDQSPRKERMYRISLGVGCTNVMAAFPATFGGVACIRQGSTSQDILPQFTRTQVDVPGYMGYAPVPYDVYVLESVLPFKDDEELIITC